MTQDDCTFLKLLNRNRVKGKADLLSEDEKTVTDLIVCPMNVLHIFAPNKQVDIHNAAVVACLGTVIVAVFLSNGVN